MHGTIDEREAWYWLLSARPGSYMAERELLGAFGSPLEMYETPEKLLIGKACAISGRAGELARQLVLSRKENKIKEAYFSMTRAGIWLLTMDDEAYPKRLAGLYDRPAGLFVKGSLPDDERPSAAIVGSRICTAYGKKNAQELGRALAAAGIQVISGLAVGIDTAGHEGALSVQGKLRCTYGISGCGLDIVYPARNESLYAAVEAGGGLISEYPPGIRPNSWHFPSRNRLISGLSDCVAVIEAGHKSGSLITAEHALRQGKDVFALPGRTADVQSSGTNELLRDGAQVLLSPDDILLYFGIDKPGENENTMRSLDKRWQRVYINLDCELRSVGELMAATGMQYNELIEILSEMEQAGIVKRPFDQYYTV